jgi:hypothetical protein
MPATITRQSTIAAGQFLSDLKEQARGASGTFDSAALGEAASELKNKGGAPKDIEIVLDESGDQSPRLLKAILDAATIYEEKHGEAPNADLIESAFRQAYSTTEHARKLYSLDSATSLQSDPLALQPNRAIVAIMAAITEAIPFAHYLPADIGSNESKLAIMTHNAGTTYGGYAEGGNMDGVLSGMPFITSSRVHTLVDTAGTWGGKLTKVQTDESTCDQAADGVKLLRGRTLVYVAGRVVGQESSSSGTGASPVAGSVTIGGTAHVLGGSINTDTGVAALTFTPALPGGYAPVIEGFIDYERGEVAPELVSAVETFTLHAKPWRVTTRLSIDARTQMANELGLDPYGESVLAIQNQFANERHYEVLAKAVRMAATNTATFDYEWATRGTALVRADLWQDLSAVLGAVSQQMAIDTLNHGISHLYVGRYIAAQLASMPSTIFQPSGISARPGIYRLGRLFGQYEVYYSPRLIVEDAGGASGNILAVGRATDVTRNPFVLGDAVAPTVIPLAVNSDLRTGAGFYARNYTAVNPHEPSAKGAAMISVTNLL